MSAKTHNSQVNLPPSKHLDGYASLIPKWLLCVAIILLLIYYRSPGLFFEPRFWAEEGNIYFAFAFSHSIFQSLITPHYGFFGFIQNLGGILATFVPLEHAPLVTTCLAALMQLIVSSYVIFCDSPYWDTYPKKLTIACFIQILCPHECWLDTISSQYFLSILAFFILIETDAVQKSWMKWPSRILLSTSALTSPAVTFLLPAFVLKALRSRSREDWLRVAIISFGAFVQVLSFFLAWLNASSQIQGRLDSSGFNLQAIINLHMIESMIGPNYLRFLNYFGIPATLIFTLFKLYLSYILIKSFFYKQLQLPAIAFLLLTFPVVLLSLGMSSSPRAPFAPAIIMIVLMIYDFGSNSHKFLRYLDLCALSALMLFGLLTHDMKVYNRDIPGLLLKSLITYDLLPHNLREKIKSEYITSLSGRAPLPVWKDEVMLWRQDHNHILRIWPHGWHMKLESRSSHKEQNQ